MITTLQYEILFQAEMDPVIDSKLHYEGTYFIKNL